MFKKRVWYKEVILVGLIIPFASIIIAFLFGLPKSILYFLPLLAGLPLTIIVVIWRVRKKAMTFKEATALVSIYSGLNYAVSILVPWPSSFLVSFALLLIIIWRVHKRALG